MVPEEEVAAGAADEVQLGDSEEDCWKNSAAAEVVSTQLLVLVVVVVLEDEDDQVGVVVAVVLDQALLVVVDDQLEESGMQMVGTGPFSTDNLLCSIPQHAWSSAISCPSSSKMYAVAAGA